MDSRRTQLLLLLLQDAMGGGCRGGYFRAALQLVRAVDPPLLIGFDAALENHHGTLGGIDVPRLHDDGAASGPGTAASWSATGVIFSARCCARLLRGTVCGSGICRSGICVRFDEPDIVVIRAV